MRRSPPGSRPCSLVLLDSTVATTTRAYVGDGATVTSGALDVKADAFNIVTSTSVNLSISLGGGNETFITATDDSTIEARLGPAKGAASGSATVTASGDVNVTAILTSRAVGRAIGLTFGLFGTIGDMHGKATNTADASAYLGRSTTVGAGANAVNFTATSHSQTYADGIGVAASATFAGQGLFSTADLKHTVSAFTDFGGSITAGNISFTSNANENIASSSPDGSNDCSFNGFAAFAACAVATGGAVALGTLTFVNATATDAPTVRTYVGSGTQLTATGAVSVVSNVKQKAIGRTNSASVGAFGAGLTRAHALALGSVESYVNGTVTQSTSVTIRSNVDYAVKTRGSNMVGGLAGSAAISQAAAFVGQGPSDPASVKAYVAGSGNITSSGDVKVWSVVTSVGSAENQLVTVGLVGGRSADASVAIQPEIRTYADGGSTVVSTGAGVSFLAAHNYNPDGGTPGFLTGNKAEVSAGSYGGALIDIDVGSNIDATAKADVDTSIKANATVRAGTAVDVVSRSSNNAKASFKNISGALLTIKGGADITAESSGRTTASILGNIIGTDGTSAGASSINLLANGVDFSDARIEQISGGIAAIDVGNSATSSGTPTITATLGGAGSKIRATFNINAQALSTNDSDATGTSISGGLLRISVGFNVNASMSPTVSAVVTGGAQITAGGTLTLDATSNQPLPPISDGTFEPSHVNGTTNTITFHCNGTPCIHNAGTGDVVNYDNRGGSQISPDLSGRSIGVIVTGPTTIQLGTVFDADGSDCDGQRLRDEGLHRLRQPAAPARDGRHRHLQREHPGPHQRQRLPRLQGRRHEVQAPGHDRLARHRRSLGRLRHLDLHQQRSEPDRRVEQLQERRLRHVPRTAAGRHVREHDGRRRSRRERRAVRELHARGHRKQLGRQQHLRREGRGRERVPRRLRAVDRSGDHVHRE